MAALQIIHLLVIFLLINTCSSLICAHKKSNENIECSDSCYRTKDDFGCSFCEGSLDSCHHWDRVGYCCCNRDKCNETRDPPEKSGLGKAAIAGIVVAVIVVVAVIIFIACCIAKRRRKEAEQQRVKYSPLLTSKETSDCSTSRSVMQPSVSYRPPDTEVEGEMIEHEDLTNTQIQPIMEPEDKKELINSLNNPPSLPGFDEFEATPHLKKVISYGTTDSITIIEDDYGPLKDVPSDDNGFCAYVLAEMINHGPRQYPFTVETLKRVLKIGEERFAKEPSLLTIQVPCTVYGDIHGQYSDLHRWLNVNGWPNKRRSVFLGDFVDRGSHGVEVVAMMCCLKTVFPDRIYVCRGNHEEETLNKAYSFYGEVRKRFNDKDIYMHFKRVFMNLPLATIIGKKILGMHGGISPKLTRLQDIMDIERPIDDFEVGSLACDLVWSDPDVGMNIQQYRPNLDREPRAGIGQLFSSSAVLATCKRLGVDMIVRGHQAPLHGYAKWAGGKLFTLFSAPGYKGDNDLNVNMGACMEISETGEVVIKQIKVTEEFRKKRIHDVASRIPYRGSKE